MSADGPMVNCIFSSLHKVAGIKRKGMLATKFVIGQFTTNQHQTATIHVHNVRLAKLNSLLACYYSYICKQCSHLFF